MKRMKKLGNKGFSLIELIIVVAIMAILIGALAPQYMRYMERTRRANDIQTADVIRNAVQVAIADRKAPATDETYYYTSNIKGTASDSSATLWIRSVDEVVGTVTFQSTGYHEFIIRINKDTNTVIVSIGTEATKDTGAIQVTPAPTTDTDTYEAFKAGR